jgi:hypothetical protein
MAYLVFAVVAVAVYFLSDWLLRALESLAGRRFENRSVIFFGILLVTLLIAFSIVRNFAGGTL